MSLQGIAHGPGADTEKEYITMLASSARTAGDVVYISLGSSGLVDLTIANNAQVHSGVAVAASNIASGARGLYQVKGPATITVPSATYTAGRGLGVTNGAIVEGTNPYPATGTAGQAQTDFGCTRTTGTTVTSIDCFLHGQPFTSA